MSHMENTANLGLWKISISFLRTEMTITLELASIKFYIKRVKVKVVNNDCNTWVIICTDTII